MIETYKFDKGFAPWMCKVREQLCSMAVRLHENDTTRQNENNYVGIPSLLHFYNCDSSNGERHFYIVSSSNLFDRLIMCEDLSRRVMRDFPEMFGTNDARDVLQAIWKQDPNHTMIDYDHYLEIVSHEQYAWVVEYDENGIVGDKILRLDLFRKIEERADGGYDFTGGLMHVFKHFSCYGRPLSYQKSNNDIPNLAYVLRMIIEAFFMSDEKIEIVGGRKSHIGAIDFNGKVMKAIFYYNDVAGVYFINSFHE